ncbi:MAG: hypothetical protein SGI90_06730 [Candidatus Eisenbacteria bacterium]|nr:hypothetical protein [Candidatus Eisenbacteria bacterium]
MTSCFNKRNPVWATWVTAAIVVSLFLGTASESGAAGTAACREIVNQATASWTIGITDFSVSSNSVTTTVAEILDVVTTWQDASAVVVTSAATSQVLTFLVTNIGNGTDSYTLTPADNLGGDNFDPGFVRLVLDSNTNGMYDAGVDQPYLAGVDDPVLAADSSVVVFALNDVSAGLNDGDTGDFQLTATSRTGSGAPGTVIPGGGECGNNAVVGNSGGESSAIGTYVKSDVVVGMTKSAQVSDPFGGTEPVPGATVTYTIQVTISGTGTANNLNIVDPIPANTTYETGSLTLNSAGLSDALDLDAGDVGGTAADTITVQMGNVAAGGGVHTITFTVTID